MSTRDELANLILEHFRPVDGQFRLNPTAAADAIIAAGYVKADGVEWGVQSPFGNIRPCSNEGVARIPSATWTTLRRLVGPWEVA
ncbi:hypothetical protein GTG23_07040 [Rhodococcus hoagii]|nr:hypothetical protein [Prescottella equi]NKZ63090.1 hypothetical protein [Prescottella equi]NKZ64017.1 hypothetical protein [Prescottella equi]